jgi:Fe-S cluster assembly protein SufD
MKPLTQQLEKDFKADGKSWIDRIRKEAFERLSQLPYPTSEQEEWKYTPIEPIVGTPFRLAERKELLAPFEKRKHLTFSGIHAIQRVFVNGYHCPKLSSTEPLPKGMIVDNLATILQNNPKQVEPYLAQYAKDPNNPFITINTAFFQEGAFIYLPKGIRLEYPIHLVYLSQSNGAATVSHPRTLVVAEEDSEARIVETYIGDGSYWTNAVTEIVLGENARIHQCKIQEESEEAFHLSTLSIHQNRDSHANSHLISLGGKITRNDVRALLDAEGSEVTLGGLYMASDNQHVDNQTLIDHAKPHSTSDELYKGILDGKSSGVFNGRIVVRPNAQKVLARQTNKNLLLSDHAKMNTKPLLEIHADDVRCNHGATIGRLDENQLFYLQSRGMGETGARTLLTYAFASDMIQRLAYGPLETYLEILLLQRLGHPEERL